MRFVPPKVLKSEKRDPSPIIMKTPLKSKSHNYKQNSSMSSKCSQSKLSNVLYLESHSIKPNVNANKYDRNGNLKRYQDK